jgi:hypothetical protein
MELRDVVVSVMDDADATTPFNERESYLVWRIQQLEAILRHNAAQMGYSRAYTVPEADAAIERIALFRTLN